jgi:putative Se/S carrier protein
MVNEGDYVAIFNSVHRVMKAEKLLKGEKLPILLIPAPRALSSDCGLAIRYADPDRERVEALLASSSLCPEEIYQMRAARFARVDKEAL